MKDVVPAFSIWPLDFVRDEPQKSSEWFFVGAPPPLRTNMINSHQSRSGHSFEL